jgi:ABC-type glutathione transport system ATPase component
VHFEGQSLLGQSTSQWQRVRREMQMIFQDPLSSLDPKRSIGYSLEEPLIIHGVKNRKAQVAEMLEHVGLRPQDAATRMILRRSAPANRHCQGVDS